MRGLASTSPTAPAVRRRRIAGAIVAALAAAGGAAVVGDGVGTTAQIDADLDARLSPSAVVKAGGRTVATQQLRPGRSVDEGALRHVLSQRLPPGLQRASRGPARITYRYDRAATVRRAIALGAQGGTVEAVRTPVSSRIAAPVLRQAQANTCESAALEILLATTGRRVPQARLQAAFPRSGSLDPVGIGARRVWGDPDRGYVGRADGGGAAGGFGVYPGPVATTARAMGRELDDLTGAEPSRLYRRLLRGRAVMAWIGLSDGPYGEWRSPAGKRIRVNYGEHTVVLTGIAPDGLVRLVNPLDGAAETWTRTRFEAAWALLGRRALGA